MKVTRALFVFSMVMAVAEAGCPIGCGAPGMKASVSSEGVVTVFRDENEIVGSGLVGGYKDRKIEIVYGDSHHEYSGGDQLFPISDDSAFTCTAAGWDFMVNRESQTPKKWDYEPRNVAIYSLRNGKLEVSKDFGSLDKMFSLPPGCVFLGTMGGVVFYWENFDRERVFWRRVGLSKANRISIPKKVIDIYGATRGIHKDYGFVVFQKSEGIFHYAPYEYSFLEFNIN